MTVTQTAGKQHNVVPAECHLVVDIRVNDCYNNQEILDTVRKHLTAEINPRSMHLNINSSCTRISTGRNCLGKNHVWLAYPFGSIGFELSILEMGPGETLRSHSADEFIFINEIEEGIQLYIKILTDFFKQ
jgi:acetylornithine deacetylase